ncbi:hypothetical protein PUN28_014928 [Cardiocondyla obscurior]|uniref:Uncharacterized protein n=1 Tax=Cardiocondyla obscurior TaxID=286306 RepID=A0AAW2F1F3_9HYME
MGAPRRPWNPACPAACFPAVARAQEDPVFLRSPCELSRPWARQNGTCGLPKDATASPINARFTNTKRGQFKCERKKEKKKRKKKKRKEKEKKVKRPNRKPEKRIVRKVHGN